MLPPQNLKAIFFDLDNVLVYSEVMHFKAWQLVVEKYGINPALLNFQSLIGIADSTQAVILKEQYNLKDDAHTIWLLKRQIFTQLIPEGFTYPHGRENFLNTASNYITAVVSSSGKQVVRDILQAEKIETYFDFIIAHEDCSKHKPDPLPYLLALEKAQVAPEQALVIEDSPSGIRAALAANIPVIGVFKDQTQDQLINTVSYFNTFSEINDWLSKTRHYDNPKNITVS
ncbi:MAG: HAD family phosphatase [Proteobacteria bacterium]|nr:HAD family phosphatase [Pseudomonadota bacterium]